MFANAKRYFIPLCILVMAAVSLVTYSSLPDQVPSHWNLQGEVDGTMSKTLSVIFLPILTLILWGVFEVLPRIDPRGQSYVGFEGTYRRIVNAIILLLAVLHVSILTLYDQGDVLARVLLAGVAILIAFLSNELGRVKPNWFVGIRTPWTLSNDEVWRQTHIFSGRLGFAAGLLSIPLVVLLPLEIGAVVFFVAIMGWAIASVYYSYWLWRKIGQRSSPTETSPE